jgi:hypothetical protein
MDLASWFAEIFPCGAARFSPDDKYSRQRYLLKKRFGLLPTQKPALKYWSFNFPTMDVQFVSLLDACWLECRIGIWGKISNTARHYYYDISAHSGTICNAMWLTGLVLIMYLVCGPKHRFWRSLFVLIDDVPLCNQFEVWSQVLIKEGKQLWTARMSRGDLGRGCLTSSQRTNGLNSMAQWFILYGTFEGSITKFNGTVIYIIWNIWRINY